MKLRSRLVPALIASLIAILFTSQLFVAPRKSDAEVWDRRDPEVVRAEGIVQGVSMYTIPSMKRLGRNLLDWLDEHDYVENGNPLLNGMTVFAAKLSTLEEYAENLAASSEIGKTLKPNDPQMEKLQDFIEESNVELFRMITIIDNERLKLKKGDN